MWRNLLHQHNDKIIKTLPEKHAEISKLILCKVTHKPSHLTDILLRFQSIWHRKGVRAKTLYHTHKNKRIVQFHKLLVEVDESYVTKYCPFHLLIYKRYSNPWTRSGLESNELSVWALQLVDGVKVHIPHSVQTHKTLTSSLQGCFMPLLVFDNRVIEYCTGPFWASLCKSSGLAVKNQRGNQSCIHL